MELFLRGGGRGNSLKQTNVHGGGGGTCKINRNEQGGKGGSKTGSFEQTSRKLFIYVIIILLQEENP